MVGVPKSIIVQAEELHLDAIFSNLVMNVKDALEEHEAKRQKTIKVEILSESMDIGIHFKISYSLIVISPILLICSSNSLMALLKECNAFFVVSE